jgi:hypothetical protein
MTSNPPFASPRRRRRRRLRSPATVWTLALVLAAAACPAGEAAPLDLRTDTRIDRERLLRDIQVLAHDSMEGRRPGTAGIERARHFLIPAFQERGLDPVKEARTHEFQGTIRNGGEPLAGVNIMGLVPGTEHPDRFIVVTAHYDHLGIRGGEIYNGTDDNASGTAALLAIGEYLARNPLRHSVLFVALDAEEMGLQGARAWVADPPVDLERVVMNVNMDMISRSEVGELYAAGTYHYPFLRTLVEEVARTDRLTLLMGHDSPDLPPGDDWTMASDHGAFHEQGIPFIYFGVEDHPGYHHPTDTFENITPDFYLAAVETVLDFLLVADREGERILEEGRNLRP